MTSVESQVEALIPSLRRHARALTGGNASAADDLVQDTLERALNRLVLWRSGSNLRAWLFTIMRRVWLNDRRYKGRHPSDVAPDDTLVGFQTAPSQTDRLLLRDLSVALTQLSPDQKEAVLLVGLEDMSYAEVAEVTGVPVGTVMSRLKRGRERLRLLMLGTESAIRRVK